MTEKSPPPDWPSGGPLGQGAHVRGAEGSGSTVGSQVSDFWQRGLEWDGAKMQQYPTAGSATGVIPVDWAHRCLFPGPSGLWMDGCKVQQYPKSGSATGAIPVEWAHSCRIRVKEDQCPGRANCVV